MIKKIILNIIIYFVGSGGSRVRLFLNLYKFKILRRYFRIKLERNYGVYISEKATIHPSVKFRHPVGIIIGDGVHIHENVIIYQNVTLGGARDGDQIKDNYPTILKGTTIFSGAKVLGDIIIGENVIIGANAVVTKNIPSNCLAVGVPARIIKK